MKKKNDTTQTMALSIPNVQPKPTKSEVINALLTRAKVKHDAENERRQALRNQLADKIKSTALKDFRSKVFNGDPRFIIQWSNGHVEIDFIIKTDAVIQLIRQHEGLRRIAWEEGVVKQEIRDAIEGRSPLLENPEAVKAMDAMLESWGI